MSLSLIVYLKFTWDNARGEKSLAWPTAPGRITQSRIQVIEYEYSVGGRVYRNRNVDLQIRDSHERGAMRAFVNSYPVGKAMTAHYDPQNPGYAF